MIVHDQYSQVKAIMLIRNLDLDKKHEVKISEYKPSKTLEQLNLYWKWMTILGDEFGYSKDEMSEFLKEELIQPTFVKIKGKIRSVRPSLSKMKINEMSELMDRVLTWAGSQGLSLPHPEDQHNE